MGRGFTLIELTVVLGLLGFMLLLSFPSLAGFRERVYLETSSTQLVSDLRKTQAEALACNEARSLTVNGRQFTFAGSGNTPPGGSGTAVVSGRHARRSIVVSSAGRVRFE